MFASIGFTADDRPVRVVPSATLVHVEIQDDALAASNLRLAIDLATARRLRDALVAALPPDPTP